MPNLNYTRNISSVLIQINILNLISVLKLFISSSSPQTVVHGVKRRVEFHLLVKWSWPI